MGIENAVRRILKNADDRAIDRAGLNARGGSQTLPERPLIGDPAAELNQTIRQGALYTC